MALDKVVQVSPKWYITSTIGTSYWPKTKITAIKIAQNRQGITKLLLLFQTPEMTPLYMNTVFSGTERTLGTFKFALKLRNDQYFLNNKTATSPYFCSTVRLSTLGTVVTKGVKAGSILTIVHWWDKREVTPVTLQPLLPIIRSGDVSCTWK